MEASHKRTTNNWSGCWECGRNKPCPFCGDTISREEQRHPVKTGGGGGGGGGEERGYKLPIGKVLASLEK